MGSIRQKFWDLYDAGQAWIVVTLVGVAIGLNAAVLNIVTEWLSDVKIKSRELGMFTYAVRSKCAIVYSGS